MLIPITLLEQGLNSDAVLDIVAPGDTPPSSPNAKDDEFNDGSLDPKWSWLNQGSSTWDESSFPGRGILTPPTSATDSLRCLIQTPPSGDFTVSCKCVCDHQGYLNFRSGLVLYNSGNGRLVTLAYNTGDAGIEVERWNSTTSWNANNNGAISSQAAFYYRLVLTTTTFQPFYSFDGIAWYHHKNTSEAIATFLGTVRGDLTGFGVFTTTNDNTYQRAAVFDWFRVTEP